MRSILKERREFPDKKSRDAEPLETELLVQADKLVGGSDAVLVIDDTAIPKKGTCSVGVAPQYASALGKTANCQTLVSLTLAREEVPVVCALRLFLPESWTSERAWLERAGVPAAYQTARTKPEIALAEIDRAIVAGVRSPLTIPAGYRADLTGPYSQHPLPMLITQVDNDGNELAGIRLPNVAVPLATYTGWTFRSPSIGQPGELLPLTGSFIPFPVTKAAREQAHDPRLSIEERYEGRAQYQGQVADAATKLVGQGYLLNEDIPRVVERALANWDNLTRGTTLAGN